MAHTPPQVGDRLRILQSVLMPNYRAQERRYTAQVTEVHPNGSFDVVVGDEPMQMNAAGRCFSHPYAAGYGAILAVRQDDTWVSPPEDT